MNSPSAAHVTSQRMLRWFVPRLAPAARPWGEAMLAELDAVHGRMESLAWALGGATVMLRILVKQWLRSGAHWLGSADPLAGAPRPPRRWTGVAMAVLALSLLFVPGFRQALRVAFATWSGAFYGHSDMSAIAARGEQQHDAVLLAFAALGAIDPVKREAWADRAVALDSSLTWIRAPLAYRSAWDRLPAYSPEGRRPPLVAGAAPALAPHAAELQAWDPNNAAVYLVEADWAAFLETRRPTELGIRRDETALLANTQWRAAMEKAFAAPVYDDYSERTFNLTREALRRLDWSQPVVLAVAMMPRGAAPWSNAYKYAGLLLDEADRLPPEPRLHQYWTVVRFAQQLNLTSHRGWRQGVGMEHMAYLRMLPLLQSLGRTDEAAVIDYRLREIEDMRLSYLSPSLAAQRSTYAWLASIVMASSIVAALSAALLLLAWMADALALWPRVVRLRRPARRLQRYAAPALLAACTLMYLCYRPFAVAYWFYMRAERVAEYDGLWTFFSFGGGIYSILHPFTSFEAAFYARGAALIVLVLLLAWRVRRLVHA